MGFDSFGLPAENAALQRNADPFEWTATNVEQMKEQLNRVNYHFHWRENTSDLSYYRWTQWLFIQLFNAGLAYQGNSLVNWDPVDKTVLADEQVDSNGQSWRSGAKVEKRFHRQWLVKTNAFAEELYKGEDLLDTGHWSFILATQRWWIKKPNGYLFYLPLESTITTSNLLQVFTAHPELFLAERAFIGIASTHWLANGRAVNELVGSVANPFRAGTVMDIRVVGDNNHMPPSTQASIFKYRETFQDEAASQQVLKEATRLGVGGYRTSDTYRDWLISRQRFWGTPIPIVHCPSCGPVPVDESSLPIELPHIDYSAMSKFQATSDQITSPLANFAPKEWLETSCPKCHREGARRETDTCDTFFDSSWYFLRYFSRPSVVAPFDMSNISPVYCYVGGKEHAALHLFYARFITHFLHSRGHLPFREPFRTLLMQAIVKGRAYKLDGRYISAEEAAGNPNVQVSFEKMSKSKGTGINPDVLVEQYGSDALRWTMVSVGNPESERLWDASDKEFGPTLVFFHRLLLTVEEFIEARKGSRKLKVLKEPNYEANMNKMNKAIDHSVFNVLYSLSSSYQIRNGTSSIHKLLNALRSNIDNNIVLTREFERGLGSLLIVISPFVPCFAEECWQAVSANIDDHTFHRSVYGLDFTRTAAEQTWPKVMNPNFEYIARITFRNEAGKEQESERIMLSRANLADWSEPTIRSLLPFQENEIEWIDIVKDCSIVVRLKDPPRKGEEKLTE